MVSVIKSVSGHERTSRPPALIGEILLSNGVITEDDVTRVIGLQRKESLRFGEAAVRLGLVRDEDIRTALARQFDYPYIRNTPSQFDTRLVAAYDPFGPQAEALRDLRSQLMLRWFNENQKSLAIVAPRTGQGCSTVAANLAIVFAQLGERTLLIDADMRAPRQHELFGIDPREGLTTLLGGRGSHKQALHAVEGFESLCVLCAGPAVPNPQELLSRVTFSYLMETLPANFDVVIVDTPPALEFADAQLIAARAGGCIVVTQRNKTRFDDVIRCRERLEPSGAAVLGATIGD